MTPTSGRRPARVLAAAALAAACLGLPGVPASAGVTVDPQTAAKGGYATIAFTVQSDRADASTTRLEISFPADHPLSEVLTQPKPGWDTTIERSSAATVSPSPGAPAGAQASNPVAKVTWSAATESARIGPDQFDLFSVSVGPLPADADRLVFEALQTYSDGEVVSWTDQVAGSSGNASARPAPALMLTAAPVPGADATAPTTPAATPEPATLDTVKASATDPVDDGNSRSADVTLGLAAGAALILAGVGGAAAARRRSGAS
jgi:uncharacterized protein YcnI